MSAYRIDINMILDTVFLMFVDFFKKPVAGGASRLAQKEKFLTVCTKNTPLELHLNFIESIY